MKRFSEQLKKQSESIRLTSSERDDLRARLTAYVEYHPLPVSMRPVAKKPAIASPLTSQPFIAIPINWFYVRGAATAFSLMMMVAVPVMAEYTTPGDVLYPVKVRFNEEVRSGLTLNPYEKIEWETERLERRISEARLLASEGRLTGELEAVVASAVKEHSDNAKAQIAALRVTDKDDAAIAEIAFATALSVQSEVLDKAMAKKHGEAGMALDGSTEAREGSVLASVVAEETSEATASQAATTPSYPKLMARVEIDTTAAFELFTSVKNQASPEEVVDIERRLEDIKRKVTLAVASQNPVAAPEASVEEEVPVEMAAKMVTGDDASMMMTSLAETDVAEVTDAATTTDIAPDVAAAAEVVADEAPVVEPVVLTEAEAVEVLRGVMADLRKLISFMTDIDVRQAVSVDELVPITLTPEEHQSQVLTDLETIKAFTATYGGTPLTGPGAEKINAGITEVMRLQVEVETALGTQGIALAEGNARAAIILIGDLESMIRTTGAAAVPDSPEEDTVE